LGAVVGLPVSYLIERYKRSTFFIKYNKEASGFIKNDELPKAIEQFELALSVKPRNPAIHYNLAWLYSEMKDTNKSLAHLYFAYKFKLPNLESKIHVNKYFDFIKQQPEFDKFVEDFSLKI
jgi:tetratricopeptide (TPR) repeat protein